ncbi:MAG: methyltransferase [Verrucomicrobiales bacterium]|nr:methyltransferase [Verrucomicrobiales bacterium]
METNWEELYRDGISPWDKGAPAPPLVNWMQKNPGLLQGRILVPGCGFGHDVREIVKASPSAEVLGIDISPTALQAAGKLPKAGSETYEQMDLFALPDTLKNSFDWIWEHTCFCAISPARRDEYVDAVHGALDNDGQLLAVFYLDPYDEDHRPGGGPPHGTSREELEDRFLSGGRFIVEEKFVPEVSYEGREEREMIMRLKKAHL